MTPDERNIFIVATMEEHIEIAKNNMCVVNDIFEKDLDVIFSVKPKGFRELILVITIARYLNSNYKASTDFYECKPRALYEKPIRTVLLKYNIPNGKSGPLNIAKAVYSINIDWANNKRPREAGFAVVNLINIIEQLNDDELSNFLACLLGKFLELAAMIELLNVAVVSEQDPRNLYIICERLIDEAPDGGNTAQRIFGLLLNEYHVTMETGITVNNYEDSASTTNTTSNKPGDANEETLDGKLSKIYEVTCKIFGLERIQDSYESIKSYEKQSGDKINELIVVCRKEDCPADITITIDSNIHLGHYDYKDMTYFFINIYEWIIAQLHRMDNISRQNFYYKLNEYITDFQTSENVKLLWKDIHQ